MAMKPIEQHPALILGALGMASGVLGTFALGAGIGKAPDPGVYMALAGVWFGAVIGFAVWRWGARSLMASAIAAAGTWIAWQAAVNAALLLESHWLKIDAIADDLRPYLAGLAAGAIGAFVTWAGAAFGLPALRERTSAMAIVATGAVLGLLLPWTNHYDNPAVLLVPWQSTVAGLVGLCIGFERAPISPTFGSA